MESAEVLIQTARQLGFERCGIVQAKTPPTFDAFERYIDAGQHAGMTYLAAQREARRHPKSVLPDVQSLLMMSISYAAVLQGALHPVKTLSGVAEYARGCDYHRLIRQRLKILESMHRKLFPNARCRGTVDTAPLLEKAFAAEAGLGFIGKNTLLIHPQFGSKIFLAALLSSEPLEPSCAPPLDVSCGSCTRCLDGCPTGALTKPYVLDARKCLSYWTIEERENMPPEIVQHRGNRFFGCDTCQEVCPMNRSVPKEPAGIVNPFTLSEYELRSIAAGSPLERMFR